jgi:peptidoglycan/xylan/chitin deacetylase (PgdA/CDA1 family)
MVISFLPAAGHPLQGDTSSSRDHGLLVLSYHDMNDSATTGLTVREDAFKAQLEFLRREGYQSVTLGSFDAWRRGKINLPPKSVMITFDDGNRSDHAVAFSLLKEFGFTANLFLLSDPAAYRPERLTRRQIVDMIQCGFAIGSHGVSHKSLIGLNTTGLKRETRGSKQKLEGDFGKRIQYFAYPYGNFDSQVAEAVKSSGYRGAFTTIPGLNYRDTNPFELRRVIVGRQITLELFKKAVTGDIAFYAERLKGQTFWNIKRGMFQAARVCLDELLYLDQKNKFRTERLKANAFAAEAYNKMGTILMRLGFIVEARQHFARAIVLKPDYAQARRNLNQAIREANASN